MTLQQAQELAWMANKPTSKSFVESAQVRQESDGDYVVVIEPVYGEQQIHSDQDKGNLALTELMGAASKANDRYFTLTEDGRVKECDFETWTKDWATREKAQTKIKCSSDVVATISFWAHAWSIIHMDEEVKLWQAQFYTSAKDEHYGGTKFSTFQEAKAFVDQYIAKGCPDSGFPFSRFLDGFQSSGPHSS